MRYFNFEKTAKEAGIPSDKMDEICQIVRKEFPRDEMMYELYVLRVCMAIKDSYISIEDVISSKNTSDTFNLESVTKAT